MLFPIINFVKILRFNAAVPTAYQNYVAYEFGFIFLSAFSKLPLLLLFYGGIKGRQNTRLSESTTIAEEPVDQDFTYLGIGFAISLTLGLYLIFEWIKFKKEIRQGAFSSELQPMALTAIEM